MSASDGGLECIFAKDLPDVFQLDWLHTTQSQQIAGDGAFSDCTPLLAYLTFEKKT